MPHICLEILPRSGVDGTCRFLFWVRDYLFYPLVKLSSKVKWTKNIKSDQKRTDLVFLMALFPAIFIIGIWHGASWNFFIFGLFHAIMVSLFSIFKRQWSLIPNLLRIFLTYQIWVFGTGLFRIREMGDIVHYVTNIYISKEEFLFCVLTVIPLFLYKTYHEKLKPFLIRLCDTTIARTLAFYLYFLTIVTWELISLEARPFVYFQF